MRPWFEPVELGDERLRELYTGDLRDLQRLYVRCADFFLLHHEREPFADEAREDWYDVPAGTSCDDKHMMGLFAPALAGVIDILRDWPRHATWNIGLLLVEPAARGGGAGTRMLHAIDAWAAHEGADTLRITVIPANTGGMRFWMRHGFTPVPAVGAHPTAIAFERPVAGGA